MSLRDNKSTLTMKIKLILSLSLFIASFSQAQTPIQYSTINSLDMMIANIFGVQCQGVSNVQSFSNPMSIGRFENGGIIGLNSGLVISTGIVANSGGNVSYFNSFGLGMPGDNDIYNYGLANGNSAPSFDACRVEFDFTPSVTDTIRFSYLLASEEYPEYSMSSFTDRFLFLVSENAGPSSNIAFLPGTSTAVEINSVNQIVNPQYYIDNATGPAAAFFVYDGYTTPFEAKFFAQVGSTYHIKLVISDISDDVFDSAIFLDEQQSYNDINGNLTVNGSLAEGILEVFNYVMEDTLLALPVQTITVSNGTYLADSLQTGMYHVRFTPDPVLFPGVAPLYYTNGDTWTTADAIGLPCFLNNGNINSNTLNVMSGSGIISGNIVIDTTYLKVMTEPLVGALVKLFNASNVAIAYTYSDVNGNYQFQNVETGTYTVRLDVPYIPQLNEHAISLVGNQVIIGADFSVLMNGITAEDNVQLGINEKVETLVTTYPNPASDKLFINNGSGKTFGFTIMTIEGQLVHTGIAGIGMNELNISDLSNGIYFIRIGENDLRKLIIKE